MKGADEKGAEEETGEGKPGRTVEEDIEGWKECVRDRKTCS